MWMLRIAIWYHHLRERQTPESVSDCALVVECDVGKNHALLVVEANVQFPVRPADVPAVHLERHALWLSNVDGFQISTEATFCFNCSCMVVVWWCLVEWPADCRHINVDNLLCVCVKDRAEVQRIAVLAVIRMRSVVHQRLLQTNFCSKALIITNRPGYLQLAISTASIPCQLTIAVHLMHILRRNAHQATLLNDFRILPHNTLHDLQILHSNLHFISNNPHQPTPPESQDSPKAALHP